jgi:nicotinamidase-related amidase
MNAITEKGRLLSDEERLNPAHTALVLIDIQNDFCHPDALFGKLGNDLSMMPAMAERTRVLLTAARRKGMLVLFVRATYDDEVLSAALAETYHRRGFVESQCLEGSSGAEWYGDLGPDPAAPNEVVITKHRFSAFWGSDFDLYLRANQIRTLVFTGVVTSGCVESTLRDAFFRDYYVVCASDCVAEASAARHTAALAKIDQAFGAVRDAADIAAIWDGSASTAPAFTAAAKLGRASSDFAARIHPARSALLLIDLQRDFCSVDGTMGRSGKDLTAVGAALKQASKLLAAARRAGMQVIHVRSEYADVAASEVSLFRARGTSVACQAGTAGAATMPEVAPRAGEWVVTKHRFSGFVDTRLELLLRSNDIRTLIIAGVFTPGAVESTVRDASMRDYDVVVARDAVAAPADLMHLHSASLETMSLYFADCRSTAEIVAALPAEKAAAA